MNNIRMLNSLDADQDRHSVGLDLCTNCLQILYSKKRVKLLYNLESVKG